MLSGRFISDYCPVLEDTYQKSVTIDGVKVNQHNCEIFAEKIELYRSYWTLWIQVNHLEAGSVVKVKSLAQLEPGGITKDGVVGLISSYW